MVVYLAKCSMVYNRIINLLFNHYTKYICVCVFFPFITQVRHYSLVLFIHRSLSKEIYVQSFYLLFQTSIQSLMNNSVFIKGPNWLSMEKTVTGVPFFFLLYFSLSLSSTLHYSLKFWIVVCFFRFFFFSSSFFWPTNWSTTLQNRQMFGEFTIFVVFFFFFFDKRNKELHI